MPHSFLTLHPPPLQFLENYSFPPHPSPPVLFLTQIPYATVVRSKVPHSEMTAGPLPALPDWARRYMLEGAEAI
jgi:hypothetical protein